MKLFFKKQILTFKKPAGTSRGYLKHKTSYILTLQEKSNLGIGECSFIEGLSIDNLLEYENKLKWLQNNINLKEKELFNNLKNFPSIKFGLEMAIKSLKSNDNLILYPSNFTQKKDTININGLIWMGDEKFINKQISGKIDMGFTCIKMKIGIDFEKEYKVLKLVRRKYPEIELRVDANGAFSHEKSLEILEKLNRLNIHSIEQPIKPNQTNLMKDLSSKSIIPIALDEELIGVRTLEEKKELLSVINPQYIILKPSLLGGFRECEEWIEIADNKNIKWWITSALESNIGLNAIAQWTYTLNNKLPQGLGTGTLYKNNLYPNLEIIKGGKLRF